MTTEIGRKLGIMIGREETAEGTKSAQLVGIPVNEDPTVEIVENIIINNSANQQIESDSDSAIGSEMSRITVPMIVGADTVGQFMKAALGTLVTTEDDPEAGANTHDFSVQNDNQHPSYTIVRKDGNQEKEILGARLESLEFRLVAEQYVVLVAVFVGLPEQASTTTISFPTEDLFTADDVSIKFAATIAALSGATAIPFENMTVNINKNTAPFYAVGSTSPSKIINKPFGVGGNGTLLLDDEVYYDLYRGHDVQAVEILVTGKNNIGATATKYQFSLTMPKVRTENWGVAHPLDDNVTQSFDLRAEFDKSQPTPNEITTQLINDSAEADY